MERQNVVRRLALPIAAAAALLLPALLLPGCEGTSSGVDNPGFSELTVSFRDGSGAALRVTGDLDVYAADQNPAVDPEPLATIKVRNTALTNLNGEDFARINSTSKKGAGISPATKRSASYTAMETDESPSADSAVAFNLVFRSDAGKGCLAFGLLYDPKLRRFARGVGRLDRIDLPTKPLVRFEAKIRREAVHGDLGRVYIPGTPFQATLADTVFIFESLPEGVFPLRLLNGDGRIFAVRESLDTKAGGDFTPEKEPIGRLDTADTTVRPPPFSVEAGEKREAFVGVVTVLDAVVTGIALDSLGARASILWRRLPGESKDTVLLVSPTKLSTQVKFRAPGAYSIEVAVTVGAHTARDTVVFLVREAPAPTRPHIVQPKPGDTLRTGVPTKITWEMPKPGKAVIQLAVNGGEYHAIAEHVESTVGLSVFGWTPPDSLKNTREAFLRVRMEAPDTLIALMEKPFFILAGPVADPGK